MINRARSWNLGEKPLKPSVGWQSGAALPLAFSYPEGAMVSTTQWKSIASRLTAARSPLLQMQRDSGNHYVQRMLSLAGQSIGEEGEEAIQRKKGGGRTRDGTVRQQTGSSLQAGLSNVRVHYDAQKVETIRRTREVANREQRSTPSVDRQGLFRQEREKNETASKLDVVTVQRKAQCPTIPAPKISAAECRDPRKRRCYQGPEDDMTTYVQDPDTGEYSECTYQQYVCECYDKNLDEARPYKWYDPFTWLPPKIMGGYKGWSKKPEY